MSRSAPLRILHVITQLDMGGAERQLYNLCRLLPPERFACQVLSLKAGGSLKSRFEAAGCPVHELDRRESGGTVGQMLLLIRHLRDWRPDLLQTWLLKANHVGRIAAAIAAQHPVVASYRDMGFAARLGDTLLDRLLAPSSALILHNSQGGRHAHLGRTDESGMIRHRLLPNGVDSETFRPDPAARSVIRRERGLPQDAPVVIMVARLHPIKDPGLFLAVGRAVRRRMPRARFWLVGDGPLADSLAADLAADPDPGIWLAGERKDIPRLLAAADLALLTSRSEGLSNTILEAMACGLPVIAMAVGGNAELIVEGDTGLLLGKREPEAIARRVVQVLQNQAFGAEMGRRGRERVEKLYSLNRLICRAEKIYERLILGG